MKRIKVTLTRSEKGDEVLRIAEPLFVAVIADRFVIDDQRGPISKPVQTAPVRIQRRRTAGWRMPDNTVSVTRPGVHGNPYYPGCGLGFGGFDADMRPVAWPLVTKADAVRHFREYVQLMQRDEPAKFKALVDPLRGKNLACWCALDDPCHGDVWLEFASAPVCEEVA